METALNKFFVNQLALDIFNIFTRSRLLGGRASSHWSSLIAVANLTTRETRWHNANSPIMLGSIPDDL